MTESTSLIPASLRQACPPLDKPAGDSFGQIYDWAFYVLDAYDACRAQHAALIKVTSPQK
jgi:hypothetical protein